MAEPITVTVRQASELTGISQRRLYQLFESGQVERRYIGSRNYVVVWSSLKDWIQSRPTEPDQ